MWTGLGIAAAGLGGALIGSQASGKAADQQSRAAGEAAATNLATYRTTRADLAPYREAGTTALQRLMYLTGVGGGGAAGGQTLAYRGASDLVSMEAGIPSMNQKYANDPAYVNAWNQIESQHRAREGGRSYIASSDPGWISGQVGEQLRSKDEADAAASSANTAAQNDPAYGSLTRGFTLADFAKDPGYDFRLGEGEKALDRGATARGLSSSTPGLKNLMRFNQDYASNEYGAAYGRFRDTQSQQFNLLSYLAGTGQNAAAMTGQVGVNTAAGVSGSMLAAGQAQAAGTLGAASSFNNAFQGSLGNYMYMQRFNQLMQRMPVFSQSPAANSAPVQNTGTYGE